MRPFLTGWAALQAAAIHNFQLFLAFQRIIKTVYLDILWEFRIYLEYLLDMRSLSCYNTARAREKSSGSSIPESRGEASKTESRRPTRRPGNVAQKERFDPVNVSKRKERTVIKRKQTTRAGADGEENLPSAAQEWKAGSNSRNVWGSKLGSALSPRVANVAKPQERFDKRLWRER